MVWLYLALKYLSAPGKSHKQKQIMDVNKMPESILYLKRTASAFVWTYKKIRQQFFLVLSGAFPY